MDTTDCTAGDIHCLYRDSYFDEPEVRRISQRLGIHGSKTN
ncbi:hypothetical protein VDG1235_4836 [Verrucomicrobiia bacterium DG1235]|nr:hypothetical protein VDG1235_1380 [Verrucomicrobiae bacterium DG1235]EDY82976.1 hypothetical protein VDG1235_2599 [Verrucomicrobiae bacterium DG1235]EDY85201.1 hypothetical protein VDG1235_4836 [Verrucomicrobiae bacterium DG1235]